MTSSKQQLLEALREHSFAKRAVTLASGATSDWFVDCKQTVLLGIGHRLVGEVLLTQIRAQFPAARAVAGVALGGCPLVSAVSLTSALEGPSIDAFYVRKQAKDHGSVRWIEGDDGYPDGADVVVLEDVVTTAGSTLDAVKRLSDGGHRVLGVVALVDREAGGRQNLERENLIFDALYVRADFFSEGTE